MSRLGNVVSERRKELGLSQRQLAGLAKCSNSTVSRIENEVYGFVPNVRTLRKLAKVLGLAPASLAYEEAVADANITGPTHEDAVREGWEQALVYILGCTEKLLHNPATTEEMAMGMSLIAGIAKARLEISITADDSATDKP